jgi:hypothetical protein
VRIFEAGVRALWIREGAAKGDIKLTSRGAVVGEIAARLSGGYMSGWTYPYASGVDPAAGALDIAVGEAPRGIRPTRNWVSAERAFLSIPGTVASVSGGREALQDPYVKDVFFRVAPGDSVVFPCNNVEKCGNVISQAPDRDRAIEAAEAAARKVLIRLEPGDPATEDFLFGEGKPFGPDGPSWPPSAFAVSDSLAAAADSLEDVPPASDGNGPCERIAYVRLAGIERETARDWHRRTLEESLKIVERWTGIEAVDGHTRADGSVRLLGRTFWKALFRGGYQGAAYAVDSLRPGSV